MASARTLDRNMSLSVDDVGCLKHGMSRRISATNAARVLRLLPGTAPYTLAIRLSLSVTRTSGRRSTLPAAT